MASQQMLEQEIGTILSANPVQLSHPGRSIVASGLYAQPANSKLNVVPELNTIGRLKISSNSLNFGSSSQFQIPPQSFNGQMFLHGEVACDRYVQATSTWLLDMIERIEYQISGNSSINNVSLDGESHRDLIMASVEGEEKRLKMFRGTDVVDSNAAAVTASATIPLYLPWSAPDREGAFPFDTSTLSSNIIVTIRWRPGYRVFFGTSGQSPTLPTAFSALHLKSFQTDLLNGAFAVSRAMSMDPSLTYSMPTYLCQSYKVDQSITTGSNTTISLTSLPQGQLVAVLCSAVPTSYKGVSAGNVAAFWYSPVFSYSELLHNGQQLYLGESLDEIRCINALCKKGGSYDYESRASPYAYATPTDRTSFVMAMPLVYNLETALEEKHHQAVPSYGGSVLQHTVQIPATGPNGETFPTGEVYTFTYTFIFNSIVENSNRVTSMVI
jgi:hypothetical protein